MSAGGYRFERDGQHLSGEEVCRGMTTLDTRSLHVAQLQQLPFLGHATVSTAGRPAPLHGSWADQVDLESSMRPEQRQVRQCEPRTVVNPMSLYPWVDLVCPKQQNDYREPPVNDRMMHKQPLNSRPKTFDA
jgi:hypothetical protein